METNNNDLAQRFDKLMKRIAIINDKINSEDGFMNSLYGISGEYDDEYVIFISMDNCCEHSFTKQDLKKIMDYAKSLLPNDETRKDFIRYNKHMRRNMKESLSFISELCSTAKDEGLVDFKQFENKKTLPAILAEYQAKYRGKLNEMKSVINDMHDALNSEILEDELFGDWGY